MGLDHWWYPRVLDTVPRSCFLTVFGCSLTFALASIHPWCSSSACLSPLITLYVSVCLFPCSCHFHCFCLVLSQSLHFLANFRFSINPVDFLTRSADRFLVCGFSSSGPTWIPYLSVPSLRSSIPFEVLCFTVICISDGVNGSSGFILDSYCWTACLWSLNTTYRK